MAKSTRRGSWYQQHVSDPYVKQSVKEGYRSRACYKLLEVHEKNGLIKPGQVVIDLGAAPGGWSQVSAKLVKPKGKVFALDLLEMAPIEGVTFLQGDFEDDSIIDTLMDDLSGQKVDWVLSDMSPDLSGILLSDQMRIIHLVELVCDFAQQVLKPSGGVIVKVFQGTGFDDVLKLYREHFKKVVIRKPKASRPASKEVYLLAQHQL